MNRALKVVLASSFAAALASSASAAVMGVDYVKTSFTSANVALVADGGDFSQLSGASEAGGAIQLSNWWGGGTQLVDRTYVRVSGDTQAYAVTITSNWATDINGGRAKIAYSLDGGSFTYSAPEYPGSSYSNVKTTSLSFNVAPTVTSLTVRRVDDAGSYDAVRIYNWSDTFSVPEPTSLSLLAVGTTLLMRRRRA